MKIELTQEQHQACQQLCESVGITTTAGLSAFYLMVENAILLDRKQQDYGPRNISSFGLIGVIVRMNDKMERLKNLTGTKRKKARNESIKDSLKDMCNYAVIGEMLERGLWPMT